MHEKRKVGFGYGGIGVPAGRERSICWMLTGRENLEFPSALYKIHRLVSISYIDYLIKLMGLEDRLLAEGGIYLA